MTPLSQRQEKTGGGPAPGGPHPREVPKGKLTYEDFLAWLDEDTWAEWVRTTWGFSCARVREGEHGEGS